jgi:S-layer homology domain
MANQPKSYRKFLAGTVTAAIVASAVAPAAGAEEVQTSFTDVPADDVHAANIAKAVEMELINGYDDNTFKPYQAISRGQVAKIIARHLGEVDTTGVEQFTDVAKSGDTELHGAALTVKAANIFTGRNGELDFEENITREEMASVIVRVFEHLTDLEDKESAVTDIEAAYPVHQDNIKLLSEWGITDVEVFNPKGDLQRAQFVSFMIRAIESIDVAPEVTEVSAIDATTLSVALSDGTVHEVTLDVALVDGENEVTFTIGEVEYTVTVEFDAEAAALVEATTAVEIAEVSLLQEDLDAAQALVDELTASDEKILLNARLAAVQNDIDDVIQAVNDATGELSLYRALDVVPFENVVEDYIADYKTAIDAAILADGDFTSTSDIQDVIDQVNTDKLATDITNAENAVVTVDGLDVTTTDAETFNDAVEAAQTAIDALPSDFTRVDEETPVVEQLQEELDSLVVRYNNYVNIVEPVVNASSQVELYNELVANFDNTVEANIPDYDFTGMTTVEEVQYEINFENTENTINDFVVDADTTQADIDTLKALVPLTGADDADGNPTATLAEQGLLDIVDGYQDAFDALTEATTELASAVADAEAAQASYVAAGGDVEATVYTDVTADLEAVESVDMDLLAEINTATTNLTTTTTALETETELIVALDEAIAEAKAAQASYVAAGGADTDADYVAVTTALEADPQVTADIEAATTTLEAATAELVLVSSVNEAVTATELQPQLVKLNEAAYNNMSATQRLEVAGLFLESHSDTEYTASSDIATDLLAVIGTNAAGTESGYYLLLADVNNATTISETDLALEALNVEEYESLTAAEQLVVAENVLNNKDSEAVGGAYSSITQIVNNF